MDLFKSEDFFIISFMNSLKLSILYPFVIYIYLTFESLIKALNLVKDCLPLPLTPINNPLPLDSLKILEILRIF